MNATGAATAGVYLGPVVIRLVSRLQAVSRSADVRDASGRVGEAVGEVWERIGDLGDAVTAAWRGVGRQEVLKKRTRG